MRPRENNSKFNQLRLDDHVAKSFGIMFIQIYLFARTLRFLTLDEMSFVLTKLGFCDVNSHWSPVIGTLLKLLCLLSSELNN